MESRDYCEEARVSHAYYVDGEMTFRHRCYGEATILVRLIGLGLCRYIVAFKHKERDNNVISGRRTVYVQVLALPFV